MSKTTKKSAFQSPWVWTIFGMFAIIFTVNYGFISAALQTSPGLVTEEYYKHGLQQNKFEKQWQDQAARGWKVALSVPKPWAINKEVIISINVQDKYGNPVSDGTAEITAYRPSDSNADITVELPESDKKGVYQTTISLPLKGAWDINLLFRKGDDKHMMNERIFTQSDQPSKSSRLETVVDLIRQKSAE
jgi:nitrogen fixation protein FixH